MDSLSKVKLLEKLSRLPLSRSGDRAPRLPFTVAVQVAILQTGKSMDAETLNISRSGILFKVSKDYGSTFKLGLEVKLLIQKDGYYLKEDLACEAQVARIQANAAGDKLFIGCRFI